MLIWNDNCSIGMDLIDTQHQHLFEIGNKIYTLLKTDLQTDKYKDIILIVQELRDYTKYHFKCEENYMLEINYPGFEEQKKEHNEFIKQLEEMDINSIHENQQKHIEDLMNFVFDWLLSHILEKDKLIMAL